MLPQLRIKGSYFRKSHHSYSNMAGASREAVIDLGFLRGRQKETVVKELCVASATASDTFRFRSPNKMAGHGSSENGINWAEGHIEYKELHTVVTEAVAGFAHLYAYIVSKVSFLYPHWTYDP
jgi:stalled ribosome alternative rescue factor ArfA